MKRAEQNQNPAAQCLLLQVDSDCLCLPDDMKETAAKRRDKAAGRDSKAGKPKEPEPQDVEMPEEEAANAAKAPKELDALTLDGECTTPDLVHNTVWFGPVRFGLSTRCTGTSRS